MAEDIVAALAAQRKKALLSKTPSWLDRDTCVLGERTGNIDLTFHCQCNDTCKVQQTIDGTSYDAGDYAISVQW